MRRVGGRVDTAHGRPPCRFSACNQCPPAGAIIALQRVAFVRLVALRPLGLRPVAPSAVFYSALLDAGPPCRTPPCRTFALLHSALSHVRPVARCFHRVRHVGFRPVARSDAAHSALSLSGSLDSAALLRSDPSHSNLRASSDSLEYAPGAQRSKKLRRPDSNPPHSHPHSSVLATAL